MARHNLTVAKATNEEFRRVWRYVHAMENLLDARGIFDCEEEWRTWPDDDPDKRTLLRMERQVAEEDGTCWDGKADNRLVLYHFMKHAFTEANRSGSLGRILCDCETLIHNCCDPAKDYLEFKPSIMYAHRDALLKVERLIARDERRGTRPETILKHIRKMIDQAKQEAEEDQSV